MRTIRNKKKIFISLFIALAVSAYYFYLCRNKERPFTSDDAETAIHYYNYFVKGIELPIEIKVRFLSFLNICSFITYRMLGCTVLATQLIFTEKFFLCIFLCNIIILNQRSSKFSKITGIFIFVFMVVFQSIVEPGILSSHFHTDPLICFLFFILIFEKLEESSHKLFILFFLSLITILQIDFLMLPIFFVPVVVYLTNYYRAKNLITNEILGIAGFLIVSLAASLNAILNIIGTTKTAYQGYGSKKFSSIDEILNNIVLLLKGLPDMFNANIFGMDIISLDILNVMIKIAILFLAIISVYRGLRISNDKKEYYISISIVSSVLTFILTGSHNIYEIRYISSILFLVPLQFVLMMKGKLEEIYLKRNQVIVALCMGVTCLGQIGVYHNDNMDEYYKIAVALKENGLRYGVGGFWIANVTTVLSDYDVEMQAVALGDTMFPEQDEWSFYRDKSNCFDFIVVDKDLADYQIGDYGVTDARVKDMFGIPQKIIEVENRKIFIYDHDIRTISENITCKNSKWIYSGGIFKGEIASNENVQWVLDDLEIGEYYAIIDGRKLGEETELIIDGENAEVADVDEEKNVKFYFTINQFADENQFMIKNGADHQIKVHDVVIQRIREAIDLQFDDETASDNKKLDVSENGLLSDQLKITAGAYKIVIYGENIDDLLVETESDISNFSAIEQGKERVVYTFSCSEDTDFQVNLSNNFSDNVLLTNVSIEMQDNDNVRKYSARQLWRNENTELVDGCIELNKNGTQYGPYVDLKKGVYRITVKGQNLDKGVYECYGENASAKIDLQDVEAEDDRVTYYIVLDRDMQSVECLVHNSSDDTVSIASCTIEKVEE